MKTQIIFLVFLIILLHGYLSEEHMEFKDIPINGHHNKLVDGLHKLGFTELQSTLENQLRHNGVYLEKNCEIYVYWTRKSQTAYKVTVNLPGEGRDYSCSGEYFITISTAHKSDNNLNPSRPISSVVLLASFVFDIYKKLFSIFSLDKFRFYREDIISYLH